MFHLRESSLSMWTPVIPVWLYGLYPIKSEIMLESFESSRLSLAPAQNRIKR